MASLTAITALVASVLALRQYFKTRREKMAVVRQAFDGVVASLASKVEVERLAAAILLRRFYDQKTEAGVGGSPFWKEAVNVSTAILKQQATGTFQKILADGLAFAPTLERADLQRTNLQFAYLGTRKLSGDIVRQTNLRNADFYRADLSGASLKGADAHGAQFYQTRLRDTVLKDADLTKANFYEADLTGARLKGAWLGGATFVRARGLPPEIAGKLDSKGAYPHLEPFQPATDDGASEPQVFISQPGVLSEPQRQFVAAFLARLDAAGLTPVPLKRRDYPCSGSIAEIRRLMGGCAGAVVFGFKQLEVGKGVLRIGTAEEEQVENLGLATPWIQFEVGMAVMLGLPLYVLCQSGVKGGVFDLTVNKHHFYRACIEDGCDADEFLGSFANWCSDVKERALTSPPHG